jgi:RND family efflux transporter MFP subunit
LTATVQRLSTMPQRAGRARAFACAAGLAFAAACGPGSTAAAPPAVPPEMTIVQVAPEMVRLTSDWVATLDGFANAEIRPQVSGYLIKRDYEEGALVKRGDVLFEIDRRPFEMVLAEAKARVAEAQAQLTKSQRDITRDTPLAEQHAIARSQLDNDVSAREAAEATLASATAAVQAADLNLEFTKVTSLLEGVAAIATAQIGDLVGPSTLLTTVSQVDPIKAFFPLSEQEYIRIADRLNTRNGQPWSGTSGLELILADGSVYPRKGRFVAVDRQIDVKTGTIRVAAAFPNPTRTLRPGEFGRVRAETTVIQNALLVPQRAVTELQSMSSVRVVTSDNTVHTRQVTTGERVDNRWVIRQGLNPGDRVVVEGPVARDGTKVSARPFAPPAGGR